MSTEPVDFFDVGPSGSDNAGRDNAGSDGSGTGGSGVDGAESDGSGAFPTWVTALAALVALLAFIGAVGVWRYRARTVTTVRTVAAGAPVGVDAAGCPIADLCHVDASPRLVAVVLSWDPDATLVTATDVRSAAGTSLRSTLVADTSVTFVNGSPLERARSVLTVVAQCVPGGAAVSSSVRADPGRRVQVVTVAGRPGCSVTVTSEAEDGVAVPIDSLSDLAHRRGLQLQ